MVGQPDLADHCSRRHFRRMAASLRSGFFWTLLRVIARFICAIFPPGRL